MTDRDARHSTRRPRSDGAVAADTGAAGGTEGAAGLVRRDFLRVMGFGAGTTVLGMGLPLNLLAAADPGQNPLAGSVDRGWEKVYRDQYRYDSMFDWVCSPNDTHACRVRAYVRNGIVTRLGATYDYQKYSDL